MTAMPAMTPYMATWPVPYSLAVGSSSSREMNTMMPPTPERNRLLVRFEKKARALPMPVLNPAKRVRPKASEDSGGSF